MEDILVYFEDKKLYDKIAKLTQTDYEKIENDKGEYFVPLSSILCMVDEVYLEYAAVKADYDEYQGYVADNMEHIPESKYYI